MVLWTLVFVLMGYSVPSWFGEWNRLSDRFGCQQKIGEIQKVIFKIEELQGLLESGCVPTRESWASLKDLCEPWGPLLFDSMEELRQGGFEVLPSLRRFKNLALGQREFLKKAKTRSAQSLVQALTCLGLVPIFGSLLYALLPGLEEQLAQWLLACVASALASGAGVLWMLKQSESARWGGLPKPLRGIVLTAQSAGERMLSLIRSGTPSDLAWVKMLQWMELAGPVLAEKWGHSVWSHQDEKSRAFDPQAKVSSSLPSCLLEAGRDLKQAIWISVMEGRSCLERVETALASLASSWDSQVEREISLLATRNLKPLFLSVAPSLLGLMAFGLWLSWKSQGGFGA